MIPRSAFVPEIDPDYANHKPPKWVEQLRVDGNVVILTKAEFDSIPEYSTTMPTGVYQGKVFKSRYSDTQAGTHWGFRWMEEYPHQGKRMIMTHTLPLIVLENH